ncbi:MAG: hypothetical protein WC934_12580 [Acidithiobacillus sp.]|jgi:hypothetical protein|uniref:hypothetical protein n=1 Tax=Acidithiobacillus sp. TaxID=1872118 RepID=UPI00355DC1B5
MSVKQVEAAGILSSSNSVKEARISPFFCDLKLSAEDSQKDLQNSGFPKGLSYASARITTWNVSSSSFITPVFVLGPSSDSEYAINETVTITFTYYGGLVPNASWPGGRLIPDASKKQYFSVSSNQVSGTDGFGWTKENFEDDITHLLFKLETDIEYGVNDSITVAIIRGRGIHGEVGTIKESRNEQFNVIRGAHRAFGPVM